MAIIRKGQILLEAEPLNAVNEVEGKIWRRIIEKSALHDIEQKYAVISTKLLAGQTVVNIYSEQDPGNRFEHVKADLEDVYFCTMAGHYGNASAKQQEVSS
jgi:hypothetical protein